MYLNRIYHETKQSHKGLIVFDKSAYESSLQKLSLEFRQQGTRWRNVKNIREVPFFVDSRASRLIQLADHVAYSVFRRYNAGDLTYFNCIENRFDNHQGIIHGLAHKQPCVYLPCVYNQKKPHNHWVHMTGNSHPLFFWGIPARQVTLAVV